MNKEDKLKWLIREGLVEATDDGYRLTEEGEYIAGRCNDPSDWRNASWRFKEPEDWTRRNGVNTRWTVMTLETPTERKDGR